MAARGKQSKKRNGRTRDERQQRTSRNTAPQQQKGAAAQAAEQREFGQQLAQPRGKLMGEVAELRTSIEGGVAEAQQAVRESAGKVGTFAREAQEGAREAGQAALNAVKRNPIPAALAGVGAACTGIGIAWMLRGNRDGAQRADTNGGQQSAEHEGVGASAHAVLSRASEGTQKLAKRARSTIAPAAHEAAERLHRAARDARAEGQLLGEMAEQKFRNHPLAVGAAMFALGTAVGASLPSTVREGRWLGARRDALVGRARQAASGAVRKVESIARPAPAASR